VNQEPAFRGGVWTPDTLSGARRGGSKARCGRHAGQD